MKIIHIKRLFVLLLWLFVGVALADLNVYEFEDANKEAEFKTLINELRCPKCQNNNLADSNAPLSTDIKNYVYNAINNGTDKAEIVDFLASKYGDFITFKPRFAGRALWVWVLPLVVLLFAVLVIVLRLVKRSSRPVDETPLPPMQSLIDDYLQTQQTEQAQQDKEAEK